jgi:hypothetical protein
MSWGTLWTRRPGMEGKITIYKFINVNLKNIFDLFLRMLSEDKRGLPFAQRSREKCYDGSECKGM